MGLIVENALLKARHVRDTDLDTLHFVRDKLQNVGMLMKNKADNSLEMAEELLNEAMAVLEKGNFKTFSIERECKAEGVERIEDNPELYAELQEFLDSALEVNGVRPRPTLVVANLETDVMLAIDEKDFSSHIFYKPIGEE